MEPTPNKVLLGLFAAVAASYVFSALCFVPSFWQYVSSSLSDDAIVTVSLGVTTLILDKERLAFSMAGSLLLEAVFLSSQATCWFAGRCGTHADRWAIATKSHVPYPPRDLIRAAAVDTALGHLFRPLLLWLAVPLLRQRGCSLDVAAAAAFPCPAEALAHITAAIQVDDFLFYWTHRLMHENKWLYR